MIRVKIKLRTRTKMRTGMNGVKTTAAISNQDTPLPKRREVGTQKICAIGKQNIAEDNRRIMGHMLLQIIPTITISQTATKTTTTTTKITTSTHPRPSTKIHGTRTQSLLERKETNRLISLLSRFARNISTTILQRIQLRKRSHVHQHQSWMIKLKMIKMNLQSKIIKDKDR